MAFGKTGRSVEMTARFVFVDSEASKAPS